MKIDLGINCLCNGIWARVFEIYTARRDLLARRDVSLIGTGPKFLARVSMKKFLKRYRCKEKIKKKLLRWDFEILADLIEKC